MNAPATNADTRNDDRRRVAEEAALVAALAARGHVVAPAPGVPPAAARERPWFVSLLLGFAGWLAGIFGLACIGMLLAPSADAAWFAIGVVLLVLAWIAFRQASEANFFGSQFGLVLSIAGQAGALFGIAQTFFKSESSLAGIALTAFVLQVLAVIAMPNRLQRTLSTLFACVAWAIALRFLMWDEAGWRPGHGGEEASAAIGLPLLAWLLAWAPPALVLARTLQVEAHWMAAGDQALMRPVCAGLVVALAWGTLFSDPLDALRWSGDHLNGDALWPLLSLLAAVGALLASFALRSPGLMGACIVAGLVHVAQFYEVLAMPLIAKSVTLLALGVLALAGARRLKRREARR